VKGGEGKRKRVRGSGGRLKRRRGTKESRKSRGVTEGEGDGSFLKPRR